MTDSEGMAEDAPVAPALAAPEAPAQDLVTEHDAATVGQASAAVAPRRRRRWPAFLLAVLVILGLAAGVVVWAPWIPPPVLRPTGLVAGPSTANSIAFHWLRPRTGPLPDKYLILGEGMQAATVAGTVTTYRQAGLTPADTYLYHVVAVRGGKRSPQSAALSISTLTPPLSEARLQGSWQVYVKNLPPAPAKDDGYMTWQVTPVCAAGACDVTVNMPDIQHSFTVKLTRAGAAYVGQAVANSSPCGSGANAIPDPTTYRFQLRVNTAAGQNVVWAATSLTGTMVTTSHYVSSGAGYCSATTYKATLKGSPS